MYACYLLTAGWLGHLGWSPSLPTHTFFPASPALFRLFLQHDARSTPHTYGINVLGAAAVKANSDLSKASPAEMRCRMKNGTYGRIEKSACEALQWSVWELKLWEGIMGELLGWLWICYGKSRIYRTGRRSPPPLNHAGSGGKTAESYLGSFKVQSKTVHSVILTMAISLSFLYVVLVSGSLLCMHSFYLIRSTCLHHSLHSSVQGHWNSLKPFFLTYY